MDRKKNKRGGVSESRREKKSSAQYKKKEMKSGGSLGQKTMFGVNAVEGKLDGKVKGRRG